MQGVRAISRDGQRPGVGKRLPEVRGLAQGCAAGLRRTQPGDLSISLGCLLAPPRNSNPANATNEVSHRTSSFRAGIDCKSRMLFFFSSVYKAFVIESSERVLREGVLGSVQKGLYSADTFLFLKKINLKNHVNVVTDDVAKLQGLAADGAII